MAENWFETAFGAHYPLLYAHRDDAEAQRCLGMLDDLVSLPRAAVGPVLDLGCGDGRHLEILSGMGVEAVGLDLSPDLLQYARDRAGWSAPPELVRGDMRHLPYIAGSFSAVLSLFTAFGYFGPPAANQDPVREIARVLAPGGHWYLDYFDGDKVREELGSGEPSLRVREMGPLSIREERQFKKEKSVVCKEVRLFPLPGREKEAGDLAIPRTGLGYTEEVAVFTRDQLERMAAAEGMEPVAASGGYENQALGEGSRWILVFRKMAKALKI